MALCITELLSCECTTPHRDHTKKLQPYKTAQVKLLTSSLATPDILYLTIDLLVTHLGHFTHQHKTSAVSLYAMHRKIHHQQTYTLYYQVQIQNAMSGDIATRTDTGNTIVSQKQTPTTQKAHCICKQEQMTRPEPRILLHTSDSLMNGNFVTTAAGLFVG